MPKATDLTGAVRGRLTVLYRVPAGKKSIWRVRCECGTERDYGSQHFRQIRSCGCLKAEIIKRGGNLRHGLAYSSTHAIWASMKSRCSNPNQRVYLRYGGRGIRVCDRWRDSFENFLRDMGERPEGMSLDRIDGNGDYTPENCRWADKYTQANNTRTNRFVTHNGKTQTIAEWSRETGLLGRLIGDRLRKYGWTAERALTTPTLNPFGNAA